MFVRAAHASGRYDRPADLLRDHLRRLATHHDLITVTEVAGRGAGLHVPRWEHYRAEGKGADECAILWNPDWEFLWGAAAPLTDVEIHTRPTVHATTVLLRHRRTGLRLLVSVAHLPAHVEGPRRWRVGRRTVAHRDAVKGWKRHLWTLRREWHPDVTLVAADWNVNVRRWWVRAWFAATWGRALGLRRAWTARTMPKRGSHGRRLIDGHLTDAHVVGARVLPEHSASDHRAVSVHLFVPRQGRHSSR